MMVHKLITLKNKEIFNILIEIYSNNLNSFSKDFNKENYLNFQLVSLLQKSTKESQMSIINPENTKFQFRNWFYYALKLKPSLEEEKSIMEKFKID